MSLKSVGQVLAKGLGIHTERYRPPPNTHDSGVYNEAEPTTKEFFVENRPSVAGAKRYLRSLFPFWSWIFHYNLTWLLGDIIAGVTVGFVVVPQGMAYALLAQLPPEYGLYTSFVGFLLYWAFATSKDITIGTVAVMSTIVGNIVIRVQKEYPDLAAEQIARGLAVISGSVLLFIGLTRFGFIVEFIPLVAITSFMTGAALNIACGQVPALLGISGINTREATYIVIINTLKNLPRAKLDAAMGMSALFALYLIRFVCSFMSRKYPRQSKTWFFISTLRMVFVVLLYTMISWLANRGISKATDAKFKILGPVPSGFQHAGAPKITPRLLEAIAPDIPTTIIVLIIEHVAISKSFGRINNYIINPSQELVAVGFTNVLGPFLGGYPATGSFSRTAIKAKAGVRTPLAGVFTAVIVLLALYALTSVFFYIPSSSLAALIIHAVLDLITPPDTVYQFWKTSPVDVVVFFAGVFVSVFTTIEIGIYVTMGAAAAVLLFRIARGRGHFLGEVEVVEKAGERHLQVRKVFVPENKRDGINPTVPVEQPYPGVFIFRFPDGFNYVNAALQVDILTIHVFQYTRRTQLDKFAKLGDRPWNDPGPRRGQAVDLNDSRPILRAIILDFSSVNFIDTTSAQALMDVRRQFNRYAAPEVVEWHFAHISNRWTKRSLVASGFGYAAEEEDRPSDLNITLNIADAAGDAEKKDKSIVANVGKDLESRAGAEEITTVSTDSSSDGVDKSAASTSLYGVNRPYFHVDLSTAVKSAIASVQRKEEKEG